MRKLFRLLLIGIILLSQGDYAEAQMFDADEFWDDEDEKALLTAKWSQLFYEINIGFNVRDGFEYQADFVYFGFGVGYPVNTKNAWRKFMPAQKIPENEQEAELFGSMDTNNIWGGKIGLGWIHYFNHAIGFYTQLNWAFLGDFGTGASSTSMYEGADATKSTFIYQTAPVEVGLCVNMWKHLHFQGGVTYMWKEIPLLTIGLGANF